MIYSIVYSIAYSALYVSIDYYKLNVLKQNVASSRTFPSSPIKFSDGISTLSNASSVSSLSSPIYLVWIAEIPGVCIRKDTDSYIT